MHTELINGHTLVPAVIVGKFDLICDGRTWAYNFTEDQARALALRTTPWVCTKAGEIVTCAYCPTQFTYRPELHRPFLCNGCY